MKKLITTILLLLALCGILAVGAAADTPPTGLAAFETISSMTTYTFSDLVSNHWAFSGIKACYDRGILIGYPDGTFYPEENVTWAHAVTVAARVHSIYTGVALNDEVSPDDEWFFPYYTYCEERGMLPSGAPNVEDYDKTDINRYCLAYIFSKLLKASDLPEISDTQISDIASVPSKYLSAVKLMYAAGIMNGMDKNAFSGTLYTTRAQLAEVVARLLIPSLRIGSDARVNSAMAAYEANLENDSIAVKIGNRYYCLYKNYVTPQTEQYSLYVTDGSGASRELYRADTGDYLNNVSAYNGKVYFCRCTAGTASGSLLCYDPTDDDVSIIYSGSIVEAYCFYNRQIYALLLTQYADKLEGYCYDFGTISSRGVFTAIHTNYTYYDVKYFQPYGWNNKIYFKLSSKDGPTNLYAYDISSRSMKLVLEKNINTSFFDGHVMYFLAFDDVGGYDSNLYAISVQTPSVVTSLGEFPPQTVNHSLRSLYKYEDTVYCLTAFNRNVYSMDKAGNSRLALVCGGIYNSMCFTADKCILIPNTLTTSNANEVKIYNSKTLAARDLYGDWLGLSCYYEGRHFIPDEGAPVLSSGNASVSTVSGLPISVSEAFFNGNDFIILAKYNNISGDTIKLRSYIVNVSVNGRNVARQINRMSGYEMRNYAIQTFTFVIGENDLLSSFDIGTDRVAIQIIPTYDVVIK